jgi:hypothetical protein
MDEPLSEMQRLVDAGDLDSLSAVAMPEEIARAWHRFHDAPEPTDCDHPDWWAVELFMTINIQRTALYREPLLELVAQATEGDLKFIGAGPLEYFVSDNEEDLAWLERECVTNAPLRQALACVWCAGDVSDATLARLDAAAQVTLSRPPPIEEWPPEVIAFKDAARHLHEIAGGMVAFMGLVDPTPAQRGAAEQFMAAARGLTKAPRTT